MEYFSVIAVFVGRWAAAAVQLEPLQLFYAKTLLLTVLGLLPLGWAVYLVRGSMLPDGSHASLRWLLYASLSVSLAGVAVTYLGAAELAQRAYLYTVVAAVVLGALYVRLRRRGAVAARVDFRGWRPAVLLLTVLLPVLILVLHHALAFPVLHWDSLFYQAVVAKHVFWYSEFPDVVGSSLGLGMDAGYPPLFSSLGAYFYLVFNASDDAFLRIISPVSYVLLVWAIFEIGRLLGGVRLGLLAALMTAVTPLVLFGAIVALYNELLAAFVALGLFFVLRAERFGSLRDWLLAGWFLGAAGLTSYNGYYSAAAVIAGALGWRAVQSFHQSELAPRRYWRGPAAMTVLIAVMNAPWLLRNLVLFKTPLHPFLSPLPFVQEFNPERTALNIRLIRQLVFGTADVSVTDWLTLFLFTPDHWPSVTLLAVVGAVVALRRYGGGFYLVLVGAAYWLAPVIQPAAHDRHALAYVSALAVLASLALWEVLKLLKRWQLLAATVLLGILFTAMAAPVLVSGKQYRLFRGHSEQPSLSPWPLQQTFLDEALIVRLHYREQPSWQYVTDNLEPGMRAAVPGHTPLYYIAGGDLGRLFLLDTVEAAPLRSMDDPGSVRDFLLERNVQYIVASPHDFSGYSFTGWKLPDYLGTADFPHVGNPEVMVYRVGG